MLSRPDVSLTADLSEMDTLLENAWFPIMRKYLREPEPSVPEILEACLRGVLWPLLVSQ